MKSFLTFKSVSFQYDSSVVLKDVSFSIGAGECVGIIGPNGGGKSTLLKLILGFLKPTKGEILFEGHSHFPLATIAYVPQSLKFDRDFPISVMEVVLMGLTSQLTWYGAYTHAARLAALEALERVGLPAFANHPFGKLSGGQAQRVLIARALVSKPRLLLLDEPTASVDTQAEGEIYSLLKELKGKMTILMVTHDLKPALHLVDRLLCVQREIYPLDPANVCEHFAIGLFHDPLLNRKTKAESK